MKKFYALFLSILAYSYAFSQSASIGNYSNSEEIYTAIEEMPQFPGGVSALMEYLRNNIQYPREALKRGIQGRVVAQFVVKKDGSIGDVKILRGVNPDFDKEIIRLCKSLPQFTPGRMHGQAVNVWYTIPPISFKLSQADSMANYLDSEKTDTVMEEMPQFPGGDFALMKYLVNNIQYPKKAMECGIHGRVVAQFEVKKDGSIGDVKIVNSINPALDKEVIRLCKSLPKFIPGKINGQAVNTWYTIPITFGGAKSKH